MTLTDGIDFPGGGKKEITPRRDRERCETGVISKLVRLEILSIPIMPLFIFPLLFHHPLFTQVKSLIGIKQILDAKPTRCVAVFLYCETSCKTTSSILHLLCSKVA